MVSVCMATYNGEKYISEQVISILNQLSPSDELIVSDDGSTDGTVQILQSFNDHRVKLFYNQGKKGPVGNFGNAISHAAGSYIFMADQDDVWFENKISVMRGYLEKYDVVNCDCAVVDDNLEVLSASYFNYVNSGSGFFKNLMRNTYMGNCMAFKKDIVDLILPFPDNIPNHDLWIGAVADLFYKPYFISQILSLHRRHSDNASNTFDIKIKTSALMKIKKRMILFSHLPALLLRFIKRRQKQQQISL